MKKLLMLVVVPFIFHGCYAPVNLTYESAETLAKGDLDVQGNYSRYYGYDWPETSGVLNYNNNTGAKLGYGLSNRYTINFRYEHLFVKEDQYSFGNLQFSDNIRYVNYFELENKIRFRKAGIAIGIPVACYSFTYDDLTSDGLLAFDPRVYFTFTPTTNKIEFSLIPKVHIHVYDTGVDMGPGFSMGMGISSDLRKWAVRPEVGYDGYISFGVGLRFHLLSFSGNK